jgi:hypothetical protein
MVQARYQTSDIPEYRGNPLIEALPPIVRDDTEVMGAMSVAPMFSVDERKLAPAIRRELVSRLNGLFIPLPPHFQLLERLSTNLRRSYLWRNPMLAQTQAYLHRKGACLSPETLAARAAAGSVLFIKGISGIGKSTGTEACLRALGPCVIEHHNYQRKPLAETQIVWLKVSCPEDRSLKSLCIAILAAAEGALGGRAQYTCEYLDDPRATAGTAVRGVMQCLANHHVGILVIDEVQNLFSSKGQAAIELLNFLLRLRDESGIGFVVCGTYASLQLLQNTFRIGRRIAAGGVTEFIRPTAGNDPEWMSFCEILWAYQWVKAPGEFSLGAALQLFDLTQGIRGLAVPLMIRAQEDAMADQSECVTPSSLLASWNRHFKQLDPPISALRDNSPEALAKWDDLCDTDVLMGKDLLAPQFKGTALTQGGAITSGNTAGNSSQGASRREGSSMRGPSAGAELDHAIEADGMESLAAEGVVGVSGLALDV